MELLGLMFNLFVVISLRFLTEVIKKDRKFIKTGDLWSMDINLSFSPFVVCVGILYCLKTIQSGLGK